MCQFPGPIYIYIIGTTAQSYGTQAQSVRSGSSPTMAGPDPIAADDFLGRIGVILARLPCSGGQFLELKPPKPIMAAMSGSISSSSSSSDDSFFYKPTGFRVAIFHL